MRSNLMALFSLSYSYLLRLPFGISIITDKMVSSFSSMEVSSVLSNNHQMTGPVKLTRQIFQNIAAEHIHERTSFRSSYYNSIHVKLTSRSCDQFTRIITHFPNRNGRDSFFIEFLLSSR